ncbi:lamin tail domain-containing protein [Kutzneria sp. CA-103260]|uniref:lamin tail domain-containing protein n=1 Tax=Kutzneria sp. CA-103260 TaxID=2802641 RepID=UPI001BA8DFD0|nr:lamin tail domain-containing protein [Kutzneria sp. CA-103260]QUQ63861.1 Lamin Tail Domain protein [Kutzneria sp. CA-103260]
MRRSFTALVTAGISALSLVTGATVASAAPQSTAPAQLSCTVVIDQFATHGPLGQNDQYVQVKNISQVQQDLSNFAIDASIGQSRVLTLATIPWGTVLQPGGVYLVANAQYSGPAPDQYWSGITLPDQVGVGLMRPPTAPVDGAATYANSPFVEGTPAAPQPPGLQPLALMRLTNSGDNAVDFQLRDRTPGRPGPVPPCGSTQLLTR